MQCNPGSDLADMSQAPASKTIENPVHSDLARLAAEFANVSDDLARSPEESLISTINSIVQPETAAEACLAPTLALFGWAGEGRLIQEALPHFDRIDNIEALRRVLSLLGYGTTRQFLKQSKIKSRSIPCLFTRDGIDVTLIVDREPDGTLLVFDGKSASWKKIEPVKQGGWAYFVWDQSAKTEAVEQGASWLFSAIKRFKPTIVATLGFNLLGTSLRLRCRSL